MARKAKAAVVSAVSNEVELVEVVAEQDGLTIEQAQDLVEVAQLVTAQPSLMAQLVEQVVTATAPEVAVVKEKNEGVGSFIKKLISEGLSNKDILTIVHEQYGNKNTTYACVAWYRNKMKKAGTVQAKSSALDFITNFAKINGLSEEAVEVLKTELKVA